MTKDGTTDIDLRTLLDATVDLVLVLAPDGRVELVNAAVSRLLATDPIAWASVPLAVLVHPADAGSAEALLVAARTHTEHGAPIDLRFRHAGGAWRTFEVTGLRLPGDAAGRLVVNAHDATERRTIEAELEIRCVEVEEARHRTEAQAVELVRLVDELGAAKTRAGTHRKRSKAPASTGRPARATTPVSTEHLLALLAGDVLAHGGRVLAALRTSLDEAEAQVGALARRIDLAGVVYARTRALLGITSRDA